MVLTQAKSGVPLKVTGINAGREASSRLASLGVLPGEIISVVQPESRGPIVLNVKGTRVALGRGICNKVSVTTLI